jgi:hypothetical protein
MINKIKNERLSSMKATQNDPATRSSGKEPRRTPNKSRQGARQTTVGLINKMIYKKK